MGHSYNNCQCYEPRQMSMAILRALGRRVFGPLGGCHNCKFRGKAGVFQTVDSTAKAL